MGGDFVVKEHLTTVLVIVPRGSAKDFLGTYEKADKFVVPKSAKQFMKLQNGQLKPLEDKDGSFDSLIKLMDDLSRQDVSVEGILRRIERQMNELDPSCEFKVLFRQKTMTVEGYVRAFQWDDAKFPRSRSVPENLAQLATTIARVDEDVKNKAYTFTEVKTTIQNLNKSRGPTISFNNADLTD